MYGLQGLKLIFKPNSINCFVLTHNPASMLQIHNTPYQNVPQSSNYTFRYFLHLQCLNCNNLQLFYVHLVRSHFSLCLGHRMVLQRSDFKPFCSACLALPCTECTQESPGPTVDGDKQNLRSMVPGGPSVHSSGKAQQRTNRGIIIRINNF